MARKGKNYWEIEGDIAKVYFRNGGFFICDADIVHDLVDSHTWYSLKGYAATTINYKNVMAHHLIAGKVNGLEVDHINRNPLDDRRCNLRHVTHAENMKNIAPFKGERELAAGIYHSYKNYGYKAFIHVNRKTIYLGTFRDYEDALKARKDAEIFYWGKQAQA